jgi:serine/threonine protein phosphatase 1
MKTHILKLDENLNGRDFVVGDIHGCYYLLDKALREVNFNKDVDRLICAGDLVDRGPYSEAVALLLEEEWVYSVLGNHEQFCIDAHLESLDEDSRKHLILTHQANGGDWFYFLSEERQKHLVSLFEQLPIMIEVPVNGKLVGVAHGNIKDWDTTKFLVESSQSPHSEAIMGVIWGRTRIRQNNAMISKGADYVFLGHTPVEGIRVLGNVHYIDTGAVFGGKLSLICLNDYVQ